MIRFKEINKRITYDNCRYQKTYTSFVRRRYLFGIIPIGRWQECQCEDIYDYIYGNYTIARYQYTDSYAVRRKYKLFNAHYWDFDIDIDMLFPTRAEALDAIWRRLVKVVII